MRSRFAAVIALGSLAACSSVLAQSVTEAAEALGAGRKNALVLAAERVGPTVVTVSVLRTELVEGPAFPQQNEFFSPFFQNLRRRYWQRVQGIGSGVIVSADGVVVTNYHVVRGAQGIHITLADGREYEARYLGGEELYDLAFVRLESAGDDLPVAPLGGSGDLLIGEWAVAIGNPFGYLLDDPHPTVTVGVISAVGRDILPEHENAETLYKDMIQTDAAINPGNSGGALVNALGEVIGINTFIFSRSGGSHGIGFAIPTRTVRRVLREILDHGKVREVWVGVRIQEIPAALAESLELASGEGVIVASVDEGSPADRAGVQRGDVIVGIAGDRIRTYDDARRALYGVMVGDEIEFTVQRSGRESRHVLTLVGRS
jgi:serine protease Do